MIRTVAAVVAVAVAHTTPELDAAAADSIVVSSAIPAAARCSHHN